MEKIGIFCSASDNIDKMYFESASQIGKWMGQTGKTLIYGMHSSCRERKWR